MAARFLIVDGHSVIFAWDELQKLHRRNNLFAREALVRQLTRFQDAAGVNVVVVFDGQGARISETTEPGGIQIFYSDTSRTADDVIERLVAKYANRHELTVATDDHLEQQTVQTFGALTISAAMLREMLAETSADFERTLKKYRPR